MRKETFGAYNYRCEHNDAVAFYALSLLSDAEQNATGIIVLEEKPLAFWIGHESDLMEITAACGEGSITGAVRIHSITTLKTVFSLDGAGTQTICATKATV
jgi:hypothetical protein